jgi:myosin heavy subunit
MPFEEFFGMYSFVGGMAKGGGDQKAKCADLCTKLKLSGKEFKLGREKIFLALGVKGNLNALRNKAMAGVAGKLQATARGMNARAKVRPLICKLRASASSAGVRAGAAMMRSQARRRRASSGSGTCRARRGALSSSSRISSITRSSRLRASPLPS